MKDLFVKYVINLYNDVPAYVYEVLVLIFGIGAILILKLSGFKKGIQYTSRLLIAEYVILLLSTTVFFRSYRRKLKYDFQPFWSYEAIQDGGEKLLPEIIMNVVAFVPVGLLLGCAFRSMTWWKVMIIGGGVSVMIEVLQYVYNRGFAEVDDVMHNVTGCLVGYGIYSLVRYGYERINKRNVGVL